MVHINRKIMILNDVDWMDHLRKVLLTRVSYLDSINVAIWSIPLFLIAALVIKIFD